jgi:hypothetical protein
VGGINDVVLIRAFGRNGFGERPGRRDEPLLRRCLR